MCSSSYPRFECFPLRANMSDTDVQEVCEPGLQTAAREADEEEEESSIEHSLAHLQDTQHADLESE